MIDFKIKESSIIHCLTRSAVVVLCFYFGVALGRAIRAVRDNNPVIFQPGGISSLYMEVVSAVLSSTLLRFCLLALLSFVLGFIFVKRIPIWTGVLLAIAIAFFEIATNDAGSIGRR